MEELPGQVEFKLRMSQLDERSQKSLEKKKKKRSGKESCIRKDMEKENMRNARFYRAGITGH